jgi:broad specificity phosphatase PhoE
VRLYPGAETYNELLQRVKSSLIEIAKAHPGEKIAVFSHGRAIKTILADILETEKTPSINNCSVSYLKYSSENPNKPFALLGVEK